MENIQKKLSARCKSPLKKVIVIITPPQCSSQPFYEKYIEMVENKNIKKVVTKWDRRAGCHM